MNYFTSKSFLYILIVVLVAEIFGGLIWIEKIKIENLKYDLEQSYVMEPPTPISSNINQNESSTQSDNEETLQFKEGEYVNLQAKAHERGGDCGSSESCHYFLTAFLNDNDVRDEISLIRIDKVDGQDFSPKCLDVDYGYQGIIAVEGIIKSIVREMNAFTISCDDPVTNIFMLEPSVEDGWKYYTNQGYGFAFKYPPYLIIGEESDEVLYLEYLKDSCTNERCLDAEPISLEIKNKLTLRDYATDLQKSVQIAKKTEIVGGQIAKRGAYGDMVTQEFLVIEDPSQDGVVQINKHYTDILYVINDVFDIHRDFEKLIYSFQFID